MDPEWKKQNNSENPEQTKQKTPVPPSAGNTPAPQGPLPSTVVRPAQTPPSPQQVQPQTAQPQTGQTPNRPAGPSVYGSSDIYDSYTGQKKGLSKKIIIAVVLLAVLLVGSVGAYFLTKKDGKSAQNSSSQSGQQGQSGQQAPQSITVPEDWQTVDTKLGFTVKAPADWSDSSTLPTSSKFENFISKTITLGSPSRNVSNPYSSGYISLSTQSLANSKSQADFEKAITDVNSFSSGLAAFGIDPKDVTVAHQDVSINGKTWLQIDTEVPGQVSRSMYMWVGDHAVALTAVSDKADKLTNLIYNYLLPMTASVELQ